MPQATNLVVKNAASVDKTFTLITPAAGDGGVAEWALKEGTISSVFPRVTASAHATPRGRNCAIKLRIPSSFTDSVTGLTNVGSAFEVNVKVAVPGDFPEALKDDCVAFATNAVATALLKAVIRDAIPAT